MFTKEKKKRKEKVAINRYISTHTLAMQALNTLECESNNNNHHRNNCLKRKKIK